MADSDFESEVEDYLKKKTVKVHEGLTEKQKKELLDRLYQGNFGTRMDLSKTERAAFLQAYEDAVKTTEEELKKPITLKPLSELGEVVVEAPTSPAPGERATRTRTPREKGPHDDRLIRLRKKYQPKATGAPPFKLYYEKWIKEYQSGDADKPLGPDFESFFEKKVKELPPQTPKGK